jgi:ribosomal protein S12 methylthiotransferase accessory factor YcaO
VIGHDDVLRALWPSLSSGTCTRLTTGAPPSRAAIELARSALRAIIADGRPGILHASVVEAVNTLHPVVAYADCGHGQPPHGVSRRPDEPAASKLDLPAGLARAWDKLKPLLGSVTGLVEPPRLVKECETPIPVATARYADASGEGSTVEVGPDGAITLGVNPCRDAFGSGLTAPQAVARAALEGLERYCTFRQPQDPILSRGQALPMRAHLCPARRVVVSVGEDRQCCAEEEWVLCSASDGASMMAVPAECCYHRHRRPTPGGATGMAVGETRDDAVVAGFLEYVEREAVNAWWREARVGTRIPLGRVEDEVVEIMTSYHRRARARSLFALRVPSPLPDVHVVVAVSSLAELGFPLLGMGAGLSLTDATAKALREVAQAFAFQRAEQRKWAAVPNGAVQWLSAQAGAPQLEWDERMPASIQGTDGLIRVGEMARNAGRIPLVFDYRRPEVPFACVRVLVTPGPGDDLTRLTAASGWGDLPW